MFSRVLHLLQLLPLHHNYFFLVISVMKIFYGHTPSFVDILNVLHHPGLTQFSDVIFYDPLVPNTYFSIDPRALLQQMLKTLGHNPRGSSFHCIFTNFLRESVSWLL